MMFFVSIVFLTFIWKFSVLIIPVSDGWPPPCGWNIVWSSARYALFFSYAIFSIVAWHVFMYESSRYSFLVGGSPKVNVPRSMVMFVFCLFISLF